MISIKQQGFTLFEVLISMFIAGVAVLGLVMLELNILRSSQSSFNYTVATIEANTLVDKTWLNLCDITNAGSSAAQATVYTDEVYIPWQDTIDNYSNNGSLFTGQLSSAVGSTPALKLQDSVIVYWNEKSYDSYDHTVADGIGGSSDNKVVLNVTFPDFEGLCLP